MDKLITNINSHLYIIKLLFSGQYLQSSNEDMKDLVYGMDDINMNISSFAADRKNLSIDTKNVSKDFRTAFEKKKLEHAE